MAKRKPSGGYAYPTRDESPAYAAARRFPCDLCGAPPGAHCLTCDGGVAYGVHRVRFRAAHPLALREVPDGEA